jgi:hypothetical protein
MIIALTMTGLSRRLWSCFRLGSVVALESRGVTKTDRVSASVGVIVDLTAGPANGTFGDEPSSSWHVIACTIVVQTFGIARPVVLSASVLLAVDAGSIRSGHPEVLVRVPHGAVQSGSEIDSTSQPRG